MGTVIGQVVTEESLREVSQKIKNSIEPKIYPEVKKVVMDGRDCIYVKFEGSQTPYFAFGVRKDVFIKHQSGKVISLFEIRK